MRNFADRVRNLRTAYGLTQKRFADRLGISRDYLSQLERGREPGQSLTNLIEMMERSGIAARVDTIVPESAQSADEDAGRFRIGPVYRSPGEASPQEPTREDCERQFSQWLDYAEQHPGMIGHTWVMLHKHFTPDS